MRGYINKQISWLWVKLVTLDLRKMPSSRVSFRPGDEERLIQALIGMNAALARASRF